MKELKKQVDSLGAELAALGEKYDSVKAVHGLGSSVAEAMWAEYMKLSELFYSTLSLYMVQDQLDFEINLAALNGSIQLN